MNKLFDLCLRIENILESNKKCVFVPAINVLSAFGLFYWRERNVSSRRLSVKREM